MRTPNRAIAVSLLVVYTCALVPTSASAQATAPQTATVVANTPIYIGASVSPTPLRVAAPGTILKVLQLQEEWVQVEFNDPQWGRRVGWVERPLLKLGADELQPMDLSVQDTDRPPPEPARFSKPQPPPQAQQFVAHSARQPRGDETMAAGVLEGEMLAEGTSTGGKLALGLGVGLLTGLIGTGIGYFVVGPDPMSGEALQRYSNRDPDYQLGLKTGWEKKNQSKKRTAFLAGGLLGTAALVAIVVSVQSQDNYY
jgi:hypothetical protein